MRGALRVVPNATNGNNVVDNVLICRVVGNGNFNWTSLQEIDGTSAVKEGRSNLMQRSFCRVTERFSYAQLTWIGIGRQPGERQCGIWTQTWKSLLMSLDVCHISKSKFMVNYYWFFNRLDRICAKVPLFLFLIFRIANAFMFLTIQRTYQASCLAKTRFGTAEESVILCEYLVMKWACLFLEFAMN